MEKLELMKTNFLKQITLIVLILLAFNCEQDQAVNLIEESNRLAAQAPVSIKTVTLSEVSESFYSLKNKYKLDNHFALKPIGNTQQKASTTTKEPITIYTDVINEITQGDYVSYTMLIKSLDDNPNTFYNLTIENKNDVEALFLTQYKNIDENSRSIATKRIDEVTKPVAAEDFGSESDDDIGGSSGGGASTNYPSDCEGTVIPTTVWVRVPCGCGHDPDSSTHNWITGCTSRPPQHPYWDEVTTYECWDTTSGNPTDTSNPSGNPTSGGTPIDVNNTTANSNIRSLTSPVGVEMGEENCQTSSIAALSNITATLGLTAQQENCLSNNATCTAINNLDDFIENNQNSIEYILLAVQRFCNGDVESLDEALDDIITQMIEDQIDDTDLDDCTKGILNDLKNLQQNDIAKIIKRFDAPNVVYKLKYKSEFFSIFERGTTFWERDSNNNPIPYNYLVTINNNPLTSTNLSRASTLIHETIHAYFLSLADDYIQTADNTLENNFTVLWNWYVQNKYNGDANSPHHETLALLYVDIAASALQEYHTGVPVTNSNEIQQLYKDLSWAGLQGTIPYNALTFSDKERIRNIRDAELYNLPQTNPSGVIEFYPHGAPCN